MPSSGGGADQKEFLVNIVLETVGNSKGGTRKKKPCMRVIFSVSRAKKKTNHQKQTKQKKKKKKPRNPGS